MAKKLADLWVSVVGLGYLPKAPGTWGSLGACFVFWFLLPIKIYSFIFLFLVILGLSLYLTNLCLINQKVKDPAWIVIDELLGQWVALVPLFFVEVSSFSKLSLVILGFVLFRFFDIVKPLGIRKIEQLPGAYGVIFDDLLAGLYAAIVIQTVLFFL